MSAIHPALPAGDSRPLRARAASALGATALSTLGAIAVLAVGTTLPAPAHALIITGGDAITGIGNTCLELGGTASTAPGSVDGFTCNGLQNQRWSYTNGQLTRANNGTALCLEVTNQATTAGSPVDLGVCGSTTTTPAQYWSLSTTGEIVNNASNLCLDWGNALTSNGSGLYIQTCSGGFTQQFWLR
jgi:hypothetical protein